MDSSLVYWLFYFIFLAIGATGFVAIPMIPLRGFIVLRRSYALVRSGIHGKIIFSLTALAIVLAVAFSIDPTIRVSRCLFGYACHPNRAGGWFLLGTIGATYLILELVLFVLVLAGRQLQPNNSFKPKPLRGSA
jgi:hypothetical protein